MEEKIQKILDDFWKRNHVTCNIGKVLMATDAIREKQKKEVIKSIIKLINPNDKR